MKIKLYVFVAAVFIFLVYLAYFLKFYVALNYPFSDDVAVWGQLGDYVGGVLNPLLSFVSIILLIKSLVLQHEANSSLKIEMESSERAEKLRSFEVLFFNLISLQKGLFDSFRVDLNVSGEGVVQLASAKAVIAIEEGVEGIRGLGGGDEEISQYLKDLDASDQLFGILRAFYVLVVIVSERLGDANGFSSGDREAHFKSLINFTDFAQLRLVMICVQFLDYESARYLRSAEEFKAVLEALGLSYEIY